ncbi:Tkp3 protein, partial [Vanderwaltozyma polyspora DSM 70294]
VNITYLKKYKERSDMYFREPPHTEEEKEERIEEVIALVGEDDKNKKYYCLFKGVDPKITVELSKKQFNRIPTTKRLNMLATFMQLVGTLREEEEGEDVV